MERLETLEESILEVVPPDSAKERIASLRERTLSGIKWVFLSSFSQRAISFVTTIILARLLMPADFGLFALAFVMIDGLTLFKSLGFDSALLRRKEEVAEAADTAFILIPLFGLILFALLFLFAPYGASLFGNPEVTPIVRTLAVIFIFNCLTQVPSVLIQKRLDFWQKAAPEITASVVFSAVAVTLAFLGFGVFSLVYAYLCKTALYMVMIWTFAKWRPRFRFSLRIAREMSHFGKFVFFGSLLTFIRNNFDNVVVGKVMGVSALGFYALSLSVASVLSQYVIGRMHGVLFSVYSKIQDDKATLQRAFLKSFKMISFLAFPFALLLATTAPTFLKVIYGDKWLPAAPVLRILAFAGLLRVLSGIMSPVFLAKGKSRFDFIVDAVQAGLFFLLVIPAALLGGLVGVGGVVLISSFVGFFVSVFRVRQILHLSARQFMNPLRPALFGSLLMLVIFGSLSALRALLGHFSAPVSTAGFIGMLALSGLFYLFFIFFADRDVRLEVRRIV